MPQVYYCLSSEGEHSKVVLHNSSDDHTSTPSHAHPRRGNTHPLENSALTSTLSQRYALTDSPRLVCSVLAMLHDRHRRRRTVMVSRCTRHTRRRGFCLHAPLGSWSWCQPRRGEWVVSWVSAKDHIPPVMEESTGKTNRKRTFSIYTL